jgi:hypothetical protein
MNLLIDLQILDNHLLIYTLTLILVDYEGQYHFLTRI